MSSVQRAMMGKSTNENWRKRKKWRSSDKDKQNAFYVLMCKKRTPLHTTQHTITIRRCLHSANSIIIANYCQLIFWRSFLLSSLHCRRWADDESSPVGNCAMLFCSHEVTKCSTEKLGRKKTKVVWEKGFAQTESLYGVFCIFLFIQNLILLEKNVNQFWGFYYLFKLGLMDILSSLFISSK